MGKIQKIASAPILRSSLYKPPIKDDYVIRQNIIDFLENSDFNSFQIKGKWEKMYEQFNIQTSGNTN